jgi:hypothetical protein
VGRLGQVSLGHGRLICNVYIFVTTYDLDVDILTVGKLDVDRGTFSNHQIYHKAIKLFSM